MFRHCAPTPQLRDCQRKEQRNGDIQQRSVVWLRWNQKNISNGEIEDIIRWLRCLQPIFLSIWCNINQQALRHNFPPLSPQVSFPKPFLEEITTDVGKVGRKRRKSWWRGDCVSCHCTWVILRWDFRLTRVWIETTMRYRNYYDLLWLFTPGHSLRHCVPLASLHTL